MNTNWEKLRLKLDSLSIGDLLVEYPEMLERGAEIEAAALPAARTYVLAGMGGSALAGELYRDAAGDACPFQLYIHRGYSLPRWVDESIPVIVSSYSGNTEEALAVFDEALQRGLTVVALGSGGELERRAGEREVPFVKLPLLDGIPPAISPRLTLPYGFAALTKLLPGPEISLGKVAGFLRSLQQEAGGENPAAVIAELVHGTLPTLYLDLAWQGVGKIWQAQFNENAKNVLELGVFSEANHNEIQTWPNEEIPRSAIFLSSSLDPEGIRRRFEFAKTAWKGPFMLHHEKNDDRLLAAWSLTYLGMWASYYLALLRGQDPSDITMVTSIKDYLKKA
jgi:glucose/mannose-6-phosphate isomerase